MLAVSIGGQKALVSRVVILQSLNSHRRLFCAAITLCLRWFRWGPPTTACSTEQAHLIPNSHSVANRSVQRTYFGTGAPEDGYALPFWWQHRGRRHCHVLSSSVHAVMHARSNVCQAWFRVSRRAQVMGMMQGKTVDDTFIVMDAFALPVEGTETRVNAQAEGYEYMVEFAQTSKQVRERTNCLVQISFWFSPCAGISAPLPPPRPTHTGRPPRKRSWLVSQPSRIRLLDVWNRLQHSDAQPTVPRTILSHRDRPDSDRCRW